MEDFLVSSDINATRNNRIIVFHSDVDISGLNHNGEMDVLSSLDMFECNEHYVYLRNYLRKLYHDDVSIMCILDNEYSINQYPLLLFMTEEYGDVVFENVSSDSDLEDGNFRSSGIFYIPEVVSQRQKEKIISLKDYFRTFNQLTIAQIQVNNNHDLDKEPLEFVHGDDFDKVIDFLNVKPKFSIKN